MTLQELLGEAFKEGMTIEDVSSALEGITFPADNSAEIEKLKNQLSKANSEAAGYKNQLREKMSEDEKKSAEEAEKWKELQDKVAALETEKAVSENKVSLLALGYDEALAEETAQAMVEGNLAKVLANQKTHLESVEQKIRAEVLNATPKPTGGNGDPKPITSEQFKAMGYSDRVKLKQDNPELYKSLTGGN